VWCLFTKGGRRTYVEEVCSSVKCLGPQFRRHRGLKEERANDVVDSTNGTLSLTILLRSVRAGKTENGVVGLKEGV
jgi:hypothetical protein